MSDVAKTSDPMRDALDKAEQLIAEGKSDEVCERVLPPILDALSHRIERAKGLHRPEGGRRA